MDPSVLGFDLMHFIFYGVVFWSLLSVGGLIMLVQLRPRDPAAGIVLFVLLGIGFLLTMFFGMVYTYNNKKLDVDKKYQERTIVVPTQP